MKSSATGLPGVPRLDRVRGAATTQVDSTRALLSRRDRVLMPSSRYMGQKLTSAVTARTPATTRRTTPAVEEKPAPASTATAQRQWRRAGCGRCWIRYVSSEPP